MKRIFIVIICFVPYLSGFSQSQGISYQAIIINKEVKEIPGVDIEGSILPEKPLTVRFTVLNESGEIDYQEIQDTQTDAYGMINLMIGKGLVTSLSPSLFTDIDWDGTPKDLQVEISVGASTSDFTEFSYQELTFVPYAFHRNITATGDLTVGGKSTFNGEVEFQDITVEGIADLNGPVNVNNGSPVNMSGNLTVLGQSTLQTLSVEDQTALNSTLTVAGATIVNNSLTVADITTLNSNLTVNAPTGLNGQVTINADVNGADNLYNSYPLRVEGSNQGIAVRVDGSRNNSNNFITFWDATGIQGRIEGQIDSEVYTEPEYIFDQAIFALQTGAQIANLATALAAAVVDPGNAIIEGVNSVTLAAEITGYQVFAFSNLGVTYESGSGDYAEWLPRLDPHENIDFGQVVGVYGGKITKRTEGAPQVMVVSRSPIVLGNMPPDSIGTANCEKVGFMGQVPVWVLGSVFQGDYILPSGGNNGMAIAKKPDEMLIEDYQKIVGIAWSSDSGSGIKLVNVAIGLHTNDVGRVVADQQEEIAALKAEIAQLQMERIQTNEVLARLVPGFKNAMGSSLGSQHVTSIPDQPVQQRVRITPPQPTSVTVTREHVERSIELIEKNMREKGIEIMNHPIFSRMQSDPAYKEEMIARVMELVRMNDPVDSDDKK